ncbi:hypothetical protein M9H77_18382 [Catharanthus roseus]|uniref:Uncharacterized protein n=1 Tax=Catharanthus roseus TaxID=4058 RepID=A0ACC0B7B8_CATRO|nr:hypothetical protein M9H77_18382 [Catharanthus roseus]
MSVRKKKEYELKKRESTKENECIVEKQESIEEEQKGKRISFEHPCTWTLMFGRNRIKKSEDQREIIGKNDESFYFHVPFKDIGRGFPCTVFIYHARHLAFQVVLRNMGIVGYLWATAKPCQTSTRLLGEKENYGQQGVKEGNKGWLWAVGGGYNHHPHLPKAVGNYFSRHHDNRSISQVSKECQGKL